MRHTGLFGRALVLAAMAPFFHGCAELAGLKDREKDEGQSSSGTGGGGGADCSPPDGAQGPTPLAVGEDSPRAIVVDEGGIYWINEGSRTGKGAVRGLIGECGAPVDLAVTTKRPYAIAADNNYIYWSNGRGDNDCDPEDMNEEHQDEVRRVRKDARAGAGGAPDEKPLWDNCGRPDSIAVDGSRVYMARPNSKRVQSMEKDGSDLQEHWEQPEGDSQPAGITVSGQYIYWTDKAFKNITQDQKTIDEEEPVVFVAPEGSDGETPTLIASDEERIYWLTEHSLRSCKIALCPSSEVQVLISDLLEPAGLAVHGDYVYVTDSGQERVLRVRKDAPETAEPIATDQLEPNGIAADGTAVYWVNYGSGEVMKLKQP